MTRARDLAAFVSNADGDIKFDTDTLFIDSSANKVGIRTNTPPHPLSVFGTGAGNATVQIEGESGADPTINFLANNAQHWAIGVDDSDSDTFKISEHSALGTNDYFNIDVNGHVGIGTTPKSDAELITSGGHGIDIESTALPRLRFYNGSTFKGGIEAIQTAGSMVAGSAVNDFGIRSQDDLLFATGGSTERMRIASDGTISLGTTLSFGGKVNVHEGGVGVGEAASSGSYRRMYWNNSNNEMRFWNGSNEARITSAGAFVDASDVSLKKDIADIEYGIDTVKSLQPRKYKIKATEIDEVGFIAQEMEAHVPEVVKSGENPDGDEQKGIAYGQLTAVLTKALQEAITKIETLETENTAIKARLDALEA